MLVRNLLLRIYRLFSIQFGLDPIKTIRSMRGLPKYVKDFLLFRSSYKGTIKFVPCFHDIYDEGGRTKSEYFWQDLLVAREIFETNPHKHVDIGSRVDGFVAHVASFREIEVFDVRPITTNVPGIVFRKADLMNRVSISSYAGNNGYCDSLSCLHALEHFGLGRYGDPIDPNGYRYGIENMALLLKHNGFFYLSIPIGWERVEFNANRIFNPLDIIILAKKYNLRLQKVIQISRDGYIKEILINDSVIEKLAMEEYNLGVFIFQKT